MRDKNRIKKILYLLDELWNKHPDYRFGQLLINYQIVPDDFTVWKNEDDGLEKYLEAILNE